jgi:hypothetical protein
MFVRLKIILFFWVFAFALTSTSAQSPRWFALEAPESIGNITVEVDVESLGSRGELRDVSTRISYPQVQKNQDISFLSVIAKLEISCVSNLGIWKIVSFYESSRGEGKLLSTEDFATTGRPINVLNLLPEKAWATMQRSACRKTTTVTP